MLPVTRVAKNNTTQIHGLSYNHFRNFVISIQSDADQGPAYGPRKRTLMFCTTPLAESVNAKWKSSDTS